MDFLEPFHFHCDGIAAGQNGRESELPGGAGGFSYANSGVAIRQRDGGARYRERTGLSEEQVNEDTVSYFYVLGMARLLGQMFEAADALAQGRSRGVMATYMMNGTSATTSEFIAVARRLAS